MSSFPIPSHVPADRVRDIPWYGWRDESGDPGLTFAELARRETMFFIPPGGRNPFGAWVLTRFNDAQKVLTDTTHFTAHHIAGWDSMTGMQELLIPAELDLPELAVYRMFMMKFMRKPALDAMVPLMREGVNQTIDTIIDRGECDFVEHCYKFTAASWCALMGVPFEDVDHYIGFLWGMLHQYDPQIRGSTAKAMLEEAEALYERNKGKPGEGMFNAFINSEIGGALPTRSQCAGFILFQMIAGLDTMGTTASWVIYALAGDPAMQADLVQNPDRIAGFVEDIFRRHAILSTNRFVKEDVEIDGVTLRKGDNVIIAMPAACMDPEQFSCPEAVHPERKERHLAFGAGPHFCVGAPVARLQLPIFVEEWLRRIPSFAIADGAHITAHTGDLTGLDSLPIRWPR